MKLTTATRITIFRIVLIPAFVICALNIDRHDGFRIAALALFVVMGISDAVDGYLARRYHQVTRIGQVLDPLADKLLTNAAYITVAITPDAWGWGDQARMVVALAVVVISRDVYIVLGFLVIYLVKGHAEPHPNRLGQATTHAQFYTLCALLAGFYYGNAPAVLWPLYAAAVAGTLASGAYYTWLGLKQIGDEPDSD